MSKDSSQHSRSRVDVFLQFKEIFPQLTKTMIPHFRVCIEEFDQNIAHVIRKNEVLEEVWHIVNILFW